MANDHKWDLNFACQQLTGLNLPTSSASVFTSLPRLLADHCLTRLPKSYDLNTERSHFTMIYYNLQSSYAWPRNTLK